MNPVNNLFLTLKKMILIYFCTGTVIATETDIDKNLLEIKEYKAIYNLERPKYDEKETDPDRNKAIIDVAYTLGVKTAVGYRYKKIIDQLETIALTLDQLTSFKPLMLEEFVIPPVISVADGTTRLIDEKWIVHSDKSYKIMKPSSMVLRPPTWRDYLLYMPPPVDSPHPAVLPETDNEKKVWQESLKKGLKDGQVHANNMFKLRWKNLLSDYIGMVNYHLLETQKMVTSPNLSKSTDAVYVSPGGNELEVNKKVWHIAKPMGFTDAEKWKTIISQKKIQAPIYE